MLFEEVKFAPVFVYTIDNELPNLDNMISDLDESNFTIIEIYSQNEKAEQFIKYEELFNKENPDKKGDLVFILFGFARTKVITD